MLSFIHRFLKKSFLNTRNQCTDLAIPFSKDALCQVWKILTKFFWKDKYENDIDNDNES